MYIKHLETKLVNLVNIKKYLENTIQCELSKYWEIRQKIKDDYKVINGHCVFKYLDYKIKLIESYSVDLSNTQNEIDLTRSIIKLVHHNIKTRKTFERLIALDFDFDSSKVVKFGGRI